MIIIMMIIIMMIIVAVIAIIINDNINDNNDDSNVILLIDIDVYNIDILFEYNNNIQQLLL